MTTTMRLCSFPLEFIKQLSELCLPSILFRVCHDLGEEPTNLVVARLVSWVVAAVMCYICKIVCKGKYCRLITGGIDTQRHGNLPL